MAPRIPDKSKDKSKKSSKGKNPSKVLAGSMGGKLRAQHLADGSLRMMKDAGDKTVYVKTDDNDSNAPSKKRKTSASSSTMIKTAKATNMLEEDDESSLANNIKSSSSKLAFKPTNVNKQGVSPHIMTSEEEDQVPLPCVMKRDGRTYLCYVADEPELEGDTDFWTLLADGLATYKPYFTDEEFGTSILENLPQCNINLAGHMFPHLLSVAGHLRYKQSTISDHHVPKKTLDTFLTHIRDNCIRLLAMTSKEKKDRETALPSIMQELFQALPGATLTEKHYNEMVAGHYETLATAAEGIRRELLPVAILTSNYTNQARKHHAKLEKLASYLSNRLLDRPARLEYHALPDKSKIKTEEDEAVEEPKQKAVEEPKQKAVEEPKQKAVEEPKQTEAARHLADMIEEESSDDESVMPMEGSGITESATTVEGSGIKSLPGVFMRDLAGQHLCQCQTCSPTFKQELEVKLVRRIHKEHTAELSDDTKQRIIAETRAKFPTDDKAILEMLRKQAKEEHEKFLIAEKDKLREAAMEVAKQEFLKELTASKEAELEERIRGEIISGLSKPKRG